MEQRPYDIRERSFLFAREVVAFCRRVSAGDYVARRIAGELLDCAGSVGANLEEAADAQSKPDFISKNSIALKECREARYWLRLIAATDQAARPSALPMIREPEELVKILQSIVLRAKQSSSRGNSKEREHE